MWMQHNEQYFGGIRNVSGSQRWLIVISLLIWLWRALIAFGFRPVSRCELYAVRIMTMSKKVFCASSKFSRQFVPHVYVDSRMNYTTNRFPIWETKYAPETEKTLLRFHWKFIENTIKEIFCFRYTYREIRLKIWFTCKTWTLLGILYCYIHFFLARIWSSGKSY